MTAPLPCIVEGCNNPGAGGGLCSRCRNERHKAERKARRAAERGGREARREAKLNPRPRAVAPSLADAIAAALAAAPPEADRLRALLALGNHDVVGAWYARPNHPVLVLAARDRTGGEAVDLGWLDNLSAFRLSSRLHFAGVLAEYGDHYSEDQVDLAIQLIHTLAEDAVGTLRANRKER